MKVVAISVGRPRQLEWQGRVIQTSIFKTPVAGRVRVTRLNIDGDQQADLSVHGRADMVKRFQRSGRSGFYLAVVREGEVGAGDAIERSNRDERALSVADVVKLYAAHAPDQPLLERASEHPALPADWRDYFRKRLREPDA